jgi:hypothetical protein
MGTKARPGRFDCYANAREDEPIYRALRVFAERLEREQGGGG